MNNLLTKIKNRVKNLHKSRLINPHMHWEFLVKFFLGLSVLLILLSFYFQYQIKNGKIIPEDTNLPHKPSLVKENLLKKVNQSFKEKKLRSIEIKSKNILFADPSQ